MYRRDREQQRQQTRQAGQIQDRDEDDVLRGDKVLQVVLQVETISTDTLPIRYTGAVARGVRETYEGALTWARETGGSDGREGVVVVESRGRLWARRLETREYKTSG